MNFWNDLVRPFFILAPMEGVTDIVFRDVIAHACPPDVFFTEFTNVSSFASEKGRKNTLTRLVPSKDVPTVAQIWGKNLEDYPITASALDDLGFAGVDINMGCPDRHVIKAGGGSDFIRHPDRAVEAIRLTKSATNLPVSIKTRLGYTFPDEFREWLPVILAEKPAALTVHLRTKKEMSKVPAHYEFIPEICELRNNISPETKLIINGDIKSREAAQNQEPEVDGFMIGRGVFENPYCFSSHRPTANELLRLFLYHLDLFDRRKIKLEEQGEKYPFEPLKHFYKVYIKDFSGANQLRQRLMSCTNTAELRDTIYQEFSELK
ncbi:MAG: tRNA-dihydrouridine synthase [Candidatus Saccharibacteria bacterium]|nr:tRNA-dihydrouridine synthase [Candidatus Saccharibacteria bacterium]